MHSLLPVVLTRRHLRDDVRADAPLDIVDRLIEQFSMPGETVFDPFMGIGTVPYCAVKLGRRGLGVDLHGGYFEDAVSYVEAAARNASVPTLFELPAMEGL